MKSIALTLSFVGLGLAGGYSACNTQAPSQPSRWDYGFDFTKSANRFSSGSGASSSSNSGSISSSSSSSYGSNNNGSNNFGINNSGNNNFGNNNNNNNFGNNNNNNGFTSSSSYPVATFPTGGSNDRVPNLTPFRISEAQATRLSSDKNVITQDDVTRTAIIQKTITTNKAIANLLDIIEQLRANINASKADLSKLQAALNFAITQQRKAQQNIMDAQNAKKQLDAAITQAKQEIAATKQNIKNFDQKDTKIKQQIAIAQANLQKLQNDLINANNDLNKLLQQKAQLQTQISARNIDINRIIAQINALKTQLTNVKNDLANIAQLILNVQESLSTNERNVANLEQQLRNARAKLAQDKTRLAEVQQLKTNGPRQIRDIENQINRKQNAELIPTQQQLARLTDQLNKINDQIKNRGNAVDDIKNKINNNKVTIVTINGTITNTSEKLVQLNNDINNGINSLKDLEAQVPRVQKALQAAYQAGNDANTRVQDCRANLDALVCKLQSDSTALLEATNNLEKARAAKQLADLSLSELVAERSNALPYAVVPNGNGCTYPGSPAGNNAIGSALGAPAQPKTLTGTAFSLSNQFRSGYDRFGTSQGCNKY